MVDGPNHEAYRFDESTPVVGMDEEGCRVGELTGSGVGLLWGRRVGEGVGEAIGLSVGLAIGSGVGEAIGLNVGDCCCAKS